MKKTHRLMLITGCMSLVLAGMMTAGAYAQPADPERGAGKEARGKMRQHFVEMLDKLNLSPEQKSALDVNREQHRKDFQTLMTTIRDKKKELAAALEEKTMDLARVEKIHGELKALIIKREDMHLAAIIGIRKILTPEQFSQFQAMMPQKRGMRPSHGEGKGEGPGMDEGPEDK